MAESNGGLSKSTFPSRRSLVTFRARGTSPDLAHGDSDDEQGPRKSSTRKSWSQTLPERGISSWSQQVPSEGTSSQRTINSTQSTRGLSVKLLEQLHTSDMMEDLLRIIKEVLTDNMLKDPDLWPCMRTFFTDLLKNLWDDCDHEIQRKIEVKVIKQDSQALVCMPDEVEGPVCSSLPGQWWCKSRAFLLNHYLPWNRSFFGKTKDPIFVAIYIVGLLPIHGLRVLLFTTILAFIVFPNHRVGDFANPDEFQLVNFILICKGAQFFSQGLVLSFCGSMLYFRCYAFQKDDLVQCIATNGPGAGSLAGQLLDYLGSIALVWLAFLVLKTWSQGRRKMESRIHDISDKVAPKESTNPGGRLWSLLFWDMKCFAFSLAMFLLMTVVTCWGQDFEHFHSQVRANLFWSRVIYSWFSLPFTLFTIPPFQQVLTHTTRTGFNAKGALVDWQLPKREGMTFGDHWQGFMQKHFPLLSGSKVERIKGHLERTITNYQVKHSEITEQIRGRLQTAVENPRAHENWAVIREKLRQSINCRPVQKVEDPHEFTPDIFKTDAWSLDGKSSQTLEEGSDNDAGTMTAPQQSMALNSFPERLAARSTSAMLRSPAIGCGTSSLLCNASSAPAQAVLAEQAIPPPPPLDTIPSGSPFSRQISSDKSLTQPLLDDSRRLVVCGPRFHSSGAGGSRAVSGASILGTSRSQSAQPVPTLRLQWMWAGVGMAMWSLPRTPERLANELERRREVRPVLIRRVGESKSRTFQNARDAAQWIQSKEGF